MFGTARIRLSSSDWRVFVFAIVRLPSGTLMLVKEPVPPVQDAHVMEPAVDRDPGSVAELDPIVAARVDPQ